MNWLQLLLLFCFSSPAIAVTQLNYKFIQLNQHSRGWWENIPVGCGQIKECALVFAFNEGDESGDRLDDNVKLKELSDRHQFILVYPNSASKNWNDGRAEIADGADDIAFVDQMLEELKKRLKIDPKRIFATGISNGGLFTFRLACERSHVFAAIAPVASNLGLSLAQSCQPTRAIPIINIVGTDDKIIPMSGGEVKGTLRFKKLGKIYSSNETINFWTNKNKCSHKPVIAEVIDNYRNDGTHALLEKYESCTNGANIYRWVIGDGGHSWPGGHSKNKLMGKVSQEINASEVIWDFFVKHPQN